MSIKSTTKGDIDEKIAHACTELIQEKTKTAQLFAEQEMEYRKIHQLYQEAHQRWETNSKSTTASSKKNVNKQQRKIDLSMYQEEVSAVFKETSMRTTSPFLLAQLSKLCYHVHLMTLLETCVKSIHEEYRIIVCWMHEYWEAMEKKSGDMKQQTEAARAALSKDRRHHEEKLKQLNQGHERSKQSVLQTRLEELKTAA